MDDLLLYVRFNSHGVGGGGGGGGGGSLWKAMSYGYPFTIGEISLSSGFEPETGRSASRVLLRTI